MHVIHKGVIIIMQVTAERNGIFSYKLQARLLILKRYKKRIQRGC